MVQLIGGEGIIYTCVSPVMRSTAATEIELIEVKLLG